MTLLETTTSQEIKACCAATYASDWARLLIGESMHPGGVELTERLGEILELSSTSHLLDVASGRGVSALALARRFGCRVTGIDLSSISVEAASRDASDSGVADRVRFEVGDAEALPFEDGDFDAVICECAFCTFPDKGRAAREMARVLRDDGRIGVSDLVCRRELPPELQTVAGWVACVADARPESEYIEFLKSAGFRTLEFESHDGALADLVQRVRGRLFAATVLAKTGAIGLRAIQLDQAVGIARMAESAVRNGGLGYVVLTAVKPAVIRDLGQIRDDGGDAA